MREQHIDGGYILLSRKLIESEIWEKPPMYLKVWLYILTKAQHKPYKNLDRGELLISIPELIEVCSHKVGYRTERPSKSQIFNILEWLRRTDEGSNEGNSNETMIDTTKTTRGMVLKVRNYNVYQDASNYERNDVKDNENTTTKTTRERQADTINKNEKNVKNDNKEYVPYAEIIRYLNEKSGKSYKHTAKGNRDAISARWNEGNDLESFKKVIDVCCSRWKGQTFSNGQKGDDYLRPSTLFNNKFDERLNWSMDKPESKGTTYKSNSVDAGDLLEGMEW